MDASVILMESIEASLLMDCARGMVRFSGIMERYSKASGATVQRMAMDYGGRLREISTKESGY